MNNFNHYEIKWHCHYCKRKPTRYYNRKHLCDFHYLIEEPLRNYRLVSWSRLLRFKLNPDEQEVVDTLYNYYKNKEVL
jgi:hypothetical protein